MKRTILIVIVTAIIAILGLMISRNAISSPLMPEPIELPGITYITGGIGEAESSMMKGLAKDYDLEIVLIQKAVMMKKFVGTKEEYLANIHLQIQDNLKNNILDVMTDGPYLLANLPSGKYRLIAEHKGDIKQQWVSVHHRNHQKIVFWWPTTVEN
ncbi:hypothetical protein GALL_17940 [mine drainage metagenome]|uniref:Carboxypeptidase regulatory-like domain-containing protein n=1 Tax=mine drainage metagenome TaxID=410659 RepID=A0A1J5TMZ1_9ZZZZ